GGGAAGARARRAGPPRAVAPPLVALAAGALAVGATAFFLPAAAVVLAAGLLVGGVAVPACAGALARRAGRGQAAARGKLAAEVVGLLTAAPGLAVHGAGRAAPARRPGR